MRVGIVSLSLAVGLIALFLSLPPHTTRLTEEEKAFYTEV